VLMDQSISKRPHVGVIARTEDGSITFYHQSSSGTGVSREEEYASQAEFEQVYSTYGRFQYWSLQ